MINRIIKFGATWCGPCKTIAAVLQEYTDKTGITIESYDVEQDSDLASTYQIRSVPTIFFMHDDEVVGKKLGTMTLNQIEEYIKELNNDTEV